VISALEKLERSGIIEDMKIFFTDQKLRALHTRKKPSPYGIAPVAATGISRRLSLFLSYEPWVHIPDAVTEHHALRIAAKKLRYTIEAYAPLYRRGLRKPLLRIKKIQEILGDLHDCDVWIDSVMVMLLKERQASRETDVSRNLRAGNIASFRRFLAEREKERKIIYRRFVRYWDFLKRVGLWNELTASLDTGRRQKYRFTVVCPDKEVQLHISRLANEFPAVSDHSRKVTDLALHLFDDLMPLHRMGNRERFLLECAGLLHDIGWKYGQKGHAGRSADMILSDEALPLDLIERVTIALIAQSHRGKIRSESEVIISLLSPDERTRVSMLAALLRVADGLDSLHLGSTVSVHCMISQEQIFLEPSALRDISAEKERAREKSDLFIRIFDRPLVIR
jgi:hypothetical protein